MSIKIVNFLDFVLMSLLMAVMLSPIWLNDIVNDIVLKLPLPAYMFIGLCFCVVLYWIVSLMVFSKICSMFGAITTQESIPSRSGLMYVMNFILDALLVLLSLCFIVYVHYSYYEYYYVTESSKLIFGGLKLNFLIKVDVLLLYCISVFIIKSFFDSYNISKNIRYISFLLYGLFLVFASVTTLYKSVSCGVYGTVDCFINGIFFAFGSVGVIFNDKVI